MDNTEDLKKNNGTEAEPTPKTADVTTDNTTEQKPVEDKTKKSCKFKNTIGKIVLYTILALFCAGEIGVLILVFTLFLSFYIAIAIAGAVGICTMFIINLIKKRKASKKPTVEATKTDNQPKKQES